MLQKLYQIAYLDEVRGCRRLFLHGESRLSRVEEIDGRVVPGSRTGSAASLTSSTSTAQS
ncbi:hypothetical protein I552_0716 [Mycobacterium xenopi 3993]|nr:hypothetical protein I552_0716 [Mycobacterium xenopi 3993]